MPKNQGTEQPTARKLEKARKEGMVARSPDLASWSVILAFSFALPAIFHALSAKIVSFGVLAFTSGATSVVIAEIAQELINQSHMLMDADNAAKN